MKRTAYNNMTFPERLLRIMEDHGMRATDLVNITDISKTAISRYLSGNYVPKIDKAELIAKALNVDVNYLLTGKTEQEKPKAVKIPVLGEVVAGVPVYAEKNIIDWEEISEEMSRRGDYFCLDVKSESMIPVMFPTDRLLVRKQNTIDSGQIAIVLVGMEEATCKKVMISDKGIQLYGFNTAVYEPHFYTNKEIRELPIRIIGRVVEVRRDLDKWANIGKVTS